MLCFSLIEELAKDLLLLSSADESQNSSIKGVMHLAVAAFTPDVKKRTFLWLCLGYGFNLSIPNCTVLYTV